MGDNFKLRYTIVTMKQSSIFMLVALALVIGFSFLFFVSQLKAPETPIPTQNEIPEEVQTETITYTNASSDLITIELPLPGDVTGKEFKILGTARGYWFFEASFPIDILDADGVVLATGIGQSIGEWMTEDFVKFSADIKIPIWYIGPATIVLKKDNPSGLPENEASISYPIVIEY